MVLSFSLSVMCHHFAVNNMAIVIKKNCFFVILPGVPSPILIQGKRRYICGCGRPSNLFFSVACKS